MEGAGYAVGPGQGLDFSPTRIADVQPDQVAGIKVEHQPRASRSSEMPIVLSVPPDPSWPVSISLFASGLMYLRRAKYGTLVGSASGPLLATARPLSVTRISPCREACRTSSPVRLCSSLIVTVFMCHSFTEVEQGWQSECRRGRAEPKTEERGGVCDPGVTF